MSFFKQKFTIGLICRCKDEFFIEEFAMYYLNEGVDNIFIIDDNSSDKSIYTNLLNKLNVKVVFEKNIIQNNFANTLYQEIKNDFDWMIYVDVDEFISTKKHGNKTIRESLETTFKNVHCIKVPWVMMSSNGLEKSPKSILKGNTYRWNHDLKHENEMSEHQKFRCRYDEIEVKCIFKTKYFDAVWDHHPKSPTRKINLKIVDGIKKEKSRLTPFHYSLREKDIQQAYLLCYHYRIISVENCKNKLKSNKWYIDNGYNLDDLLSTDYPEVLDETLADKLLFNN
ncbi:glycosyltransferase family 2 protein [Winogradskyella ludwigii]|uniref:glycosyltransferase family 2 protein n=1 Tax=Winogradskyella ludwigii TaxID=2686076 RepID=UPI0015CC72CB|nr:glycosyltransferase family 2 protein [Winogradskyella ludwigii]